MKQIILDFLSKFSCHHEWEEKYKINVYDDPSDKLPYKTKLTLVCKKCGKIKQMIL